MELPALLGLALGLELLVADDSVLEDVVAGVGALLGTLPVPLECRILLGPPSLQLVVEGVKFLCGRFSTNALLALELEQDVLSLQFVHFLF